MKRPSVIAGFLLMLLLPTTTAAQACPPTGRAADLLKKTPIGHYAQQVMTRTNTGIAEAKAASGGASILDLFNFSNLISIESIFYMLVDTDLRSVEYSRDLTEISPCLHADLAIMEAQIENVRCEVNKAYDGGKAATIRKLKTVAVFLNQRYAHLIKGALNPDHVDRTWSAYHDFDPPFKGWCCVESDNVCRIMNTDDCTKTAPDGAGGYRFFTTKDQCITKSSCAFSEVGATDPPYEDICPFDSNYLAFNASGYGCNIDLMNQFASGGGGEKNAIQAEADALKDLGKKRDDFLNDIAFIKNTSENIDDLVDNTMLSSKERRRLKYFGETADNKIQKRRVYGCNADLPPEERKNKKGVEGTLTPGIHPSQEWAAMPLRGPFFFRKDHLGIWKAFFRLNNEWEGQREFPDYLKNPEEFPKKKDRADAVKRENSAFGLLRALRDPIRQTWIDFQHKQASQTAAILPKTQDLALMAKEALKPLRPAMKRNIDLVRHSGDTLRQFAVNFTYYLRRSCIYRPCNARLETILKTLFTDECFPYVSGEFQKNLRKNPAYDQCMNTVGDESYCGSLYPKYQGDPSWKKCQDAVNKL